MDEQLLSILLSIGVFQGIVIGLILLCSTFFRSRANQFLAFGLFSISLSLLNLILEMTEAYKHSPALLVIDAIDSEFLFPAFVLLYVIYQVRHPWRTSSQIRWLFVPYFISLIHGLWSVVASDPTGISGVGASSLPLSIIEASLTLLSLVFIPLVVSLTYKALQYSKDREERQRLLHLWRFEIAFFVCWFLFIPMSLFIREDSVYPVYLLALFISLVVHWVSYWGVYRLKLVTDRQQLRDIFAHRRDKQRQPSSSQITADNALSQEASLTFESSDPANSYYQKLEVLCKEHKIHRNSSIDRSQVAELLGISPSYLSQIVKTSSGDNLATYLNSYRVEDVKACLLDPEFAHYSLLSIGLECGFSSKSTFHTVFKKQTGMTPHVYRKTHQ
ncbi:MAG: helix-turn-helix transcriptional regulator [Bacteroidota bacterium]